MSETKFTPGPWVFSPQRDTHDCCIHTADAVEEYGYINHGKGGVVGSSEWTWISDADAHLIAAAPDMYAALERLLGDAEDMNNALNYEYGHISGPCEDDGFGYVRAALAKARGEA